MQHIARQDQPLMAAASWSIISRDEDIAQLRSTYEYSKHTYGNMVMLDANMRHLLARKVLNAFHAHLVKENVVSGETLAEIEGVLRAEGVIP